MNKEEVAPGTSSADNMVLGGFPGMMIGGNRSGNDCSPCTGKLGRDESNTLDVLVSVLRGKCQFYRSLAISDVLKPRMAYTYLKRAQSERFLLAIERHFDLLVG